MPEGTYSYLEFGSLDMVEGTKEVWDFRIGQKAYDWLMVARYTNDMIAYLSLIEQLGHASEAELGTQYTEEVHHADDLRLNIGKLNALECAAGAARSDEGGVSFAELGSTIFGCIEGILFCQRLLAHLGVDFSGYDLRRVRWLGVDISEMFNRLAVLAHADYDVQTSTTFEEHPRDIDVFFAKGVSLLYAIRHLTELTEIIERSRISIFDYSFSLAGTQEATIGTGKDVIYLDYREFIRLMEDSNKKPYVRRNRSYVHPQGSRLFVDMVVASDTLSKDFIARDIRLHDSLRQQLREREGARVLLDIADDERSEWVPLEEFVESVVQDA